MTEVKPILLIYYLPDLFTRSGGKLQDVSDVNIGMQSKFNDYHVLAIPSQQSVDGSCEDVRLQVFHTKDFAQIQFQELRDMVMEEIKKLKQ